MLQLSIHNEKLKENTFKVMMLNIDKLKAESSIKPVRSLVVLEMRQIPRLGMVFSGGRLLLGAHSWKNTEYELL